MSATAELRPRSRTNGITQSPKGGVTNDDLSLLVTEEQLRRFGDGDAKRGRSELRALLAEAKDGPNFSGPVRYQPIAVRRADPADEPALLELWLTDLRSNAEHVAQIDEQKVMENIRYATQRRGGILGLIEEEGVPVGMVLLFPMQWHWSHAWFLQEMVLYVHPDHRKSHHADDLAQWSKWCADEMTREFGYKVHLLNGVLGAWNVHRKIAFYRRKFQQVGAVFVYPSPFSKGD